MHTVHVVATQMFTSHQFRLDINFVILYCIPFYMCVAGKKLVITIIISDWQNWQNVTEHVFSIKIALTLILVNFQIRQYSVPSIIPAKEYMYMYLLYYYHYYYYYYYYR